MKRRMRYLLVLAIAIGGLGIGAAAQPASAICIVNPVPEGPGCLPVPCPDLSKFHIYCLA